MLQCSLSNYQSNDLHVYRISHAITVPFCFSSQLIVHETHQQLRYPISCHQPPRVRGYFSRSLSRAGAFGGLGNARNPDPAIYSLRKDHRPVGVHMCRRNAGISFRQSYRRVERVIVPRRGMRIAPSPLLVNLANWEALGMVVMLTAQFPSPPCQVAVGRGPRHFRHNS